jgi:hypothetical protein
MNSDFLRSVTLTFFHHLQSLTSLQPSFSSISGKSPCSQAMAVFFSCVVDILASAQRKVGGADTNCHVGGKFCENEAPLSWSLDFWFVR